MCNETFSFQLSESITKLFQHLPMEAKWSCLQIVITAYNPDRSPVVIKICNVKLLSSLELVTSNRTIRISNFYRLCRIGYGYIDYFLIRIKDLVRFILDLYIYITLGA